MSEPQDPARESVTGQLPTPPYVSYKTLKGFLEALGEPLPSRIDRSLMSSMSGGTQSHLQQALRATGLVSEEGVPTERLKKLHRATDEERIAVTYEMVRSTYPFLWDSPFDLRATTSQHLDEQFRDNTSATGATVERCVNFFKAIAQDAGIELSPHIQKSKRRKVRRNGPARRREKPTALDERDEPASANPAMEHTVKLHSGAGSVTLSFAVDLFKLDQPDQKFLLDLVAKMKRYDSENQTDQE